MEHRVRRSVPPGHRVVRKLFFDDEEDIQPNVEGREPGVSRLNLVAANVDNINSNIRRPMDEEQQNFKMKYNYDTIEDVPLPGRYTWSHEVNGVRIGIDNTQNGMVADEFVNEDGQSVQITTDNNKDDTATDEFDNEDGHSSKIDSNKTPMTKTSAARGPPVKKTGREVNSDDEDEDLQSKRVVIPQFNL